MLCIHVDTFGLVEHVCTVYLCKSVIGWMHRCANVYVCDVAAHDMLQLCSVLMYGPCMYICVRMIEALLTLPGLDAVLWLETFRFFRFFSKARTLNPKP